MDIARILLHMGHEGKFNLNGDKYSGLDWTDKTSRPPKLAEIQAAELGMKQADAIDRCAGMHAATLFAVTGSTRTEERDTWDAKRSAAKNYIAGQADAGEIDLLEKEALATGEATADLAAKIMVKSDAYYSAVGSAAGARRYAEKQIEAAITVDDIAAAMTEYSLKVEEISKGE